MSQVLSEYPQKGKQMAYTMEDFHKDFVKEHLNLLSPEEVLKKFSAEEFLKKFSLEEVLEGRSSEEVLKKFSLEERLEGMSSEEIEAYLKRSAKR